MKQHEFNVGHDLTLSRDQYIKQYYFEVNLNKCKSQQLQNTQ